MIADFLAEPARIVIDDAEYVLAPASLQDWAACRQHMRAQAINAVIEGCQGMPMPEAVLGGAIGYTGSASILLEDIMRDPDGRVMLILRSLKAGTPEDKKLTLRFVQNLQPRTHTVLVEIIAAISGLNLPKGEPADPTTSSGPNSIDDTRTGTGQTA